MYTDQTQKWTQSRRGAVGGAHTEWCPPPQQHVLAAVSYAKLPAVPRLQTSVG